MGSKLILLATKCMYPLARTHMHTHIHIIQLHKLELIQAGAIIQYKDTNNIYIHTLDSYGKKDISASFSVLISTTQIP